MGQAYTVDSEPHKRWGVSLDSPMAEGLPLTRVCFFGWPYFYNEMNSA